MTDPYRILGVDKSASAEEIKAAYRKLAKQLHPDLNPGDRAVEQKFKEVSQAYDILGDAEKRKRFDRGEIDASGQQTASAHPGSGFYRAYAGGREGSKYSRFEFGPEFDVEDLVSDLFGRKQARRGADVSYAIKVDFLEAILGAKKRLRLAEGKTLDVSLKPGSEDGQTLRLKGQGKPGRGGGPAGDALIAIEVSPHPIFTRQGRDIHLELPVGLKEAALGASVQVPTVHGKVALKIPANSSSGRTLRLKGKGVPGANGQPAGDQYVTLKIVLPSPPDGALTNFLKGWAGGAGDAARRKAGLA